MQKTGTTLTKDLLDGHPNLFMYPTDLKVTYFLHGRRYQSREQFVADYRLRNPSPILPPRPEYRSLSLGIPHQWSWRTDCSVLPPERVPENIWELSESQGPLERMPVEEAIQVFDFGHYLQQFRKYLSERFSSVADFFIADARAACDATRQRQAQNQIWAFKDVGGNPELAHSFFSHFVLGKIIYLVRDPRGGFASQIDEWTRYGSPNALRHLYLYNGHYLAILEAQKLYGKERIFILRYEDLVTQPQREMQKIAQFLNLPYDSAWEQPTRFGVPVLVNTATEQQDKKVFQSSVDKWQSVLTPAQIALAETVCLDVFKAPQFGYRLSEHRLGELPLKAAHRTLRSSIQLMKALKS